MNTRPQFWKLPLSFALSKHPKPGEAEISRRPEIKVGIPVSLSGQFQTQGRQALAGLQAWAGDVNRAGGLLVGGPGLTLPVSVIHYDDRSQVGRVRQLARRLIVEDQVDLLMGPYSSVLAQSAAAVAEEHGQVLWNQGGASDSIYQRGYRWVVGILTPASEYLAGLPQLVRDCYPEAGTLAIVRAGSGSFPQTVSSGTERSAAALGYDTVLLCNYDPLIDDFSAIIDQIAAAHPDVLLAVGRIQNDLRLAAQLAQRRPNLGAAAMVAAPIQQFYDALGADAEGFIGPSQWEPPGDELDEDYAATYGPAAPEVVESLHRQSNLAVDYPMAQAYAAGLVAQRCVEAVGLEQEALRDAAAGLDFSTFYGRFKIDPDTGRQTGRSVVLVQWQQGRKVVIWPPEQRQGSLVYPWQK